MNPVPHPPVAAQGQAARPPLWPKPIPVIGLTGDYASGKTLFGLTICPGRETLVYDNEKSSASYSDLGHDRIDVPQSMLALKQGTSYTPEETFLWWRGHVRAIPPGRYRVIVLDPASEIEQGLFDFVSRNPQAFGKTPGQYAKSSALIWGDVKDYWKRILTDLASRCETFVFTVHLKAVWADNKPTNKKAPKGKSTLEELASLYLWMERKVNDRGEVPPVPAATVRKSRLVHTRLLPSGLVDLQPALPPRLPVATPTAIRQYMLTPPDYSKLRPEELAPEEKASEAELADARLETQLKLAETQLETERLKAERTRPPASQAAPPASPPPPAPQALPELPAAQVLPDEPTIVPFPEPIVNKVSAEQLEKIGELRERLFRLAPPDNPDEAWRSIVGRRGVTSARELTTKGAEALIASLAEACETLGRQHQGAQAAQPPAGAGEGQEVGALGFPCVG